MEPDNVFELDPAHRRSTWAELPERDVAPEDWARFRTAVGEIFEAFGMDLDTPGTRETPERLAVHLEASHLCTQMRGVEERSRTVTTFWRGAFEEDAELRREFLQLVASSAR